MNLLKENFKNIDPEGLDNPGFDDTTEKKSYDYKKDNKSVLDPKFVKTEKGLVAKNEPKITVPYWKLFRFATKTDIFLIFLGIMFASIASLGLPYGMIMYGEFTTLLVDREVRTGESTATNILKHFGGGRILKNATFEENFEAILEDSKAFGIGAFVGAFIQLIFAALSIDLLNRTALKQITRIRKVLLKSVLRQDMTWYDLNTSENFAVKLTDDLDKMKEGISEKLSIFIYLLMSFVISVVFSFFYGWKLTLVILSCAPFIILSTAITAKVQSSLTEKELKSYSRAGAVAEEVLGNIRTVIGFNGEEKELERYSDRLKSAETNGRKKGIYAGIGGGLMWFIIYCCYALAFWYGISLIIEDRDKDDKEYTPAVLIIVLFGVLAGAQNLGLTSPHLEAFSSAKGSAVSIFNIIDRIPEIDSLGTKGKKPKKMNGIIKFTNVTFRYPARQDVQVLNGLTLEIEAGKTVALVGSSGCGKSTCIQLIQKFYNPLSGSVSIDGINVNDWNTQQLRKFIGVVSQEPVLFATTIRENIRYGNPDASNEEIEKAARIANCHNFIMKLSEGYETSIGERGAQLSGGQKQRIAIARAIVKNPKILLLDEATSALDPTSEKRVQDALDAASRGRTTVTVTHRLSTITNADKIVYINRGRVEEQGSHKELLEKKGFYYELVKTNNEHLTQSQEQSSLHPHRGSRRYSRRKGESFRSVASSVSDVDSDYSDYESDEDEEVVKEEKPEKISTLGIIKMNSKEWPYISIGTFASCIVGASFPAFAVLFGEMYGILSLDDATEVQRYANFYSILFLGLGVITGVSTFIQTYMFNSAGVRLTSRLRSMVFNAMMSQEMSWFDNPKNAVGALCARLSSDCSAVQGASGSRIGSIVQAGSVIIIGIGISFYYNWKMTLVASVSIPLVLISIVAEARLCEKSNIKEKNAIETASKIAIEAISNIRTVASLGQEPHVLKRYVTEIDSIDDYCKQKLRYRGVVFGLGQTVPLMGYAMSLWYGGTLVAYGEMPYQNVIKVGEALIFGSWMLGQALAYAPNVSAAIISASRIMNLLNRKPTIANPQRIVYPSSEVQGEIAFKDVNFCYPSRKDILVLKDLNLQIESGKTVALVGASGSGKSTCLQFLLRYYDPNDGQVDVDRVSTVDYSLSKLRSKFGVVGQEPVLFDRTIAENIAYGDNQRVIPMSEIIEVAKQANIHDFVIKLPNGYDQSLGAKGTQLSGGQKQRIAIARALIRKPEILLLDEATSALDTQSERIVQNALDDAKNGRTCLVIAHRLSTIQNADQICVFENGTVVEKGSHNELMELGKKYAKLYRMQQIK